MEPTLNPDARQQPQVELARTLLRALAMQLHWIRFFLVRVQEILPLPPAGSSAGDADPDPVSEMHAVIGNAVRDSLNPLIRDLSDAADYEPGGFPPGGAPEGKPGQPLDLGRNDEATRRRLYALIVQDNFSPKALGDPGDVWVPPYTPEQAGLEVFWLHGRYFAKWLKLDVSGEIPEEERWELLRLEATADGNLTYREV